MNRQLLRTASVLALALLCSCIEFTSQTVTARYDAERDELRLFQVYHGIYGNSQAADAITAQEQEQLEAVMNGGRTFFFNNWITEINLSAWREAITKNQERLANPEATLGQRALLETRNRVLALAIDAIVIDNGRFYRDAEGQLCGYQQVTIRDFSKLLHELNGLISLEISRQPVPEGRPAVERAIVQTLRAAADRDYAWLRVEGNELSLHLPVAYDQYLYLRQLLARMQQKQLDKADNLPALVDSLKRVAALSGAPLEAGWRNGELVLAVGAPEASGMTVALPVHPGLPSQRHGLRAREVGHSGEPGHRRHPSPLPRRRLTAASAAVSMARSRGSVKVGLVARQGAPPAILEPLPWFLPKLTT